MYRKIVLHIIQSSFYGVRRKNFGLPEVKLSFLGIIWRVQRLEVYIYNVYITNQFQTPCDQGGEGVKSVCRGDCEQQGEKLLRLLSKLRPRTRPLDLTAHSITEFLSEFGLC
jgi:hypothetical protein